MIKILVTGATGFVGSNLARTLLDSAETEVHITIRHGSDLWRIEDILDRFNQIYITNLADRNAVFNLMGRIKPSIVYHTAAHGGFPSQTDPEQMIQTNTNSAVHLLDAAAANGIQQFINTGSSSEYGLKSIPMNEDDICRPLGLYGITKLAATNYATMIGLASLSGMKTCTLRLFSPYGPNEDKSRLYPSIVSALLADQSPKLSRPESVRDFIPIETVNQIYKQIAHTDYTSGMIMNVGSGKQQTIAEFYNQIALKMGKSYIQPIWGEALTRANEPAMWQADTGRLRSLFPEMKWG